MQQNPQSLPKEHLTKESLTKESLTEDSLQEEHLPEKSPQSLRELASLTRNSVALFGTIAHAICLGDLGALPLGVFLCAK